MVERTGDHPGTGSARDCPALSLRQVSRTLVLAQRSYAKSATASSCTRVSRALPVPIDPRPLAHRAEQVEDMPVFQGPAGVRGAGGGGGAAGIQAFKAKRSAPRQRSAALPA